MEMGITRLALIEITLSWSAESQLAAQLFQDVPKLGPNAGTQREQHLLFGGPARI
jgi:hypothetical protein